MKIRGRNVNKGEISASEIRDAYIKVFDVKWWHRLYGYGDIKIADETYRQVNLNQINQILKDNKTNEQKYVDNDYDCDDFTFQLMGTFHSHIDTAAMPIFIIWISPTRLTFSVKSLMVCLCQKVLSKISERFVLKLESNHALLSFYHNDKVIMIEPQTDEIYSPHDDWGLILLCG